MENSEFKDSIVDIASSRQSRPTQRLFLKKKEKEKRKGKIKSKIYGATELAQQLRTSGTPKFSSHHPCLVAVNHL